MDAVWNSESLPLSVRQILEAVNSKRQTALAYNTIQTVVVLLKEKKVIKQIPSIERAHQYRPTISKTEACLEAARNLAQRMFGGRLKPLIHHLVDDGDLSVEELKELEQFISNKLSDEN